MKKTSSKFNKAKEKSDAESILWGVLKSLVLSLCVLSALLFTGAAIAMSQNDPDSFCAPIGYLLIAVTLLLSGIFAAKLCKSAQKVCAIATGSVLALIAFGISIVLGDGNSGAGQFVFLAFPFVSLVGGMMASGKKNKTKGRFKNR